MTWYARAGLSWNLLSYPLGVFDGVSINFFTKYWPDFVFASSIIIPCQLNAHITNVEPLMFIAETENNTKLHLILWDGSLRELVRCFPDRKTDHLAVGIIRKKLFRSNGRFLICLYVDGSRHYRPVLKDWLDRAGEYIYLLERVYGNRQLQKGGDHVGNDIGCFRLPEVLSVTLPFPTPGLLTEIAPHAPEDCPLPFRGEVFRFDSRSLFCIYERQVPEPARSTVKETGNG
ncbi:hypothetical protein Echvi_4264 [Echinicola vietnamensis DSM 17526]|uniref:Uncharacterized protein n=2 Tax=Echinicola TaxID=390846 RepID=L0G4K4_ECHVK|nr:hypothetical protein Echvi_4264 [Echinicola vietnamensis DSM 17526]